MDECAHEQCEADRDAWRADAERLADALSAYWSVDGHRNDTDGTRVLWDAGAFIAAKKSVAAALVSHAALKALTE